MKRDLLRHLKFVAVPVPVWGLGVISDSPAYHGWRWCLHIGPRLFFIGLLTETEVNAWEDKEKQ